MKKTAALAAGLLLSACGNLPNLFDSGNGGGCNCTGTQVCHPITNKCVDTCSSASECPSASQSCTDLSGTSSKTCTCTSDGMCGLTEVCQGWGMCASKCSSSTDCPSSYTCDTSSGKCSKPGQNTDGGTDGGSTCSTANSQPDNCGYGSVCQSSGTCQTAQKGTCSNFGSTHSTASWSATSSTGPVIYADVDESPDDAAACTAGTPFTVTLKAYAGTGTFPANKSNLPGFKYVLVNGTEVDIPSMLLTPANYTVSTDSKNATMKFTLCSTVATTTLQAGFYFTGGNPYCTTLTH
ncbi:MAG: hypothetical protein IPJ65_25645 [Archangiaceae bacterium]|nr:hypothetical protein [Archangiaceae bacterium]